MDVDSSLIVYLTDSDDYKLGMFRQRLLSTTTRMSMSFSTATFI